MVDFVLLGVFLKQVGTDECLGLKMSVKTAANRVLRLFKTRPEIASGPAALQMSTAMSPYCVGGDSVTITRGVC